MFDIGFGEMILLAVIALIAIGPKQLPEVARVVGRFLNELKRMTGDFTSTLMDARHSTTQLFQETQEQIAKSLEQPTTHVGHDIHHPLESPTHDPHQYHTSDTDTEHEKTPTVQSGTHPRAHQLAFTLETIEPSANSLLSPTSTVLPTPSDTESTSAGVKKDSGSNG